MTADIPDPGSPAPPGGPDVAALAARLVVLEAQLRRVEDFAGPALWRALDAAYAVALPHRELVCIVCGRRAPYAAWERRVDACVFGGGRLERYACPDCDAVFGPQKMLDLEEAVVASDYALLYSRYAEADSTEDEIRAFRLLEPAPGGLHLDWGCGGGWSGAVARLRAEGWDVWGYEPHAVSPNPFVVSRREEVSARFDGIFSNNVIEHFRDPVAAFEDLRRVLKPGGRMVHASPCYAWDYAYTRFHTLFLLGRSPEVLAARSGFRLEARVEDGPFRACVFRAV